MMLPIDFSTPLIMGILNVTPDSFFDGGKYNSVKAALQQTKTLIDQGAAIIDIGGYSSRPGAKHISEQEELTRVLPIVEAIRSEFTIQLSVDTFRSGVAQHVIDAGATIINDISGGLLDEHLMHVVAEKGVYYVMMHMRGTSQTMQQLTTYNNVTADVISELTTQLTKFPGDRKKIIIDPGFGFAKTLDQNYLLLKEMEQFNALNLPVLVGISRKSMIYKKLNTSAEHALNGTTALHSVALLKGAKILRVHDVKEAQETITLVSSLL